MAELRSVSHTMGEQLPLKYSPAPDTYVNHGFVNDASQSQPNGNSITEEADSTMGNDVTENDNDSKHMHTDEEEMDEEDTAFSRAVMGIQKSIYAFLTNHSKALWTCVAIIFLIAYFVYFGYAMYYRFGDEGSWRLLVATAVSVLGLSIKMILDYRRRKAGEDGVGSSTDSSNSSSDTFFSKVEHVSAKLRLAIVLPVLVALALLIYIIVEIAIDHPRNLISVGGLAFYILVFFIFSTNPAKVKWRPVFWGLALQLIFALLILKTTWGRQTFQWMGDRVTEFLAYTDAGSKFVFGDLYENHFFAFKVLPVVIFFSTFVSMLYYLGVMQAVIKQLGRFLSFCLGTSPTESINAAGNIFIGQTEAPLMIRPFLKDMTNSEIHAVMTGGFATIAGAVMAAYILYKVPANHLLSASVMSAPAALAMSKLFYPETEKTRIKPKDVYNIAKGTDHNLIEAASNGASMSIKLVANIAVNLIAFVALLDFVNATLVWFGDRVGYDDFTFQLICSYVFWPLTVIMGVDLEDCRVVAELIGTKTFLNEFVAYVDLSGYINNRLIFDEYLANATANVTRNLTGHWMDMGDDIYLNDTGVTLTKGLISDRSVVIATYALCGFSNLSSMGIQLGALGAMAPSRKGDMSKIVARAMIAGNVACFMTACIAGLFYDGEV